MERLTRLAEYLPTVLIVLGFLMIGLGWNGAASFDYTEGQIPYLISGGLVGLAFVFIGTTGLAVQAIKRSQAAQETLLQEISSTLKRLTLGISVSPNGAAEGDFVIVGATSFHLPDCRVVQGRAEVTRMPRGQALEDGLAPCRICKP